PRRPLRRGALRPQARPPLHDALPIYHVRGLRRGDAALAAHPGRRHRGGRAAALPPRLDEAGGARPRRTRGHHLEPPPGPAQARLSGPGPPGRPIGGADGPRPSTVRRATAGRLRTGRHRALPTDRRTGALPASAAREARRRPAASFPYLPADTYRPTEEPTARPMRRCHGRGTRRVVENSPPPRKNPRSPRLLPARAGMDPALPVPAAMALTAPRTRGDGPAAALWTDFIGLCSPHARGWTLPRKRRRPCDNLLPARACGDGLRDRPQPLGTDDCSLHARGWSGITG